MTFFPIEIDTLTMSVPFKTIFSCISSKSALISCFASFSGVSAYLVICAVLFACGLGVPIPEDITIIAAGILVALGKISFTGATLVCLFGVLAGDAFLFFAGRRLGDQAFNLPIIKRFMTKKRIKMAKESVVNNSEFICFIARFLPGLRSPTFLTAGAMGVKPSVFLALDGLAAAISVPAWVWVGHWLGEKWDENLAIVKKLHIYLVLILAVVAFIYFMTKKYLIKKTIKK